ncbi:hypothetical protein TTHERM_00716170 (macronuclear) [Tetrahymena thermophila SB210]|uniref:Uncharacterized protein n=1 Tax=Tetrahymena thermophila (strain SB210) TaxID=312017 RepID=I7LZN0_TETTS|nr:hypothetical protein TTHERM_00716170 [Tetrahymena thermophila SB210]EAR84311.2 hypothetical protein TTHERM_00716170 [Tetrahymena thermophila SB210]|eukprot:XP_001031974.2 hypothetical protein TTHERM_00716170 [Tetrahymena thermophila SB210]
MGQLNFGRVQTKHNFVGTRASHQFIQPHREINVKMSLVDETLSVFTLIRTDTTIDLSFYAEKDKVLRLQISPFLIFYLIAYNFMGFKEQQLKFNYLDLLFIQSISIINSL